MQLTTSTDHSLLYEAPNYTILPMDFSDEYELFGHKFKALTKDRLPFPQFNPLHLHIKMTNKCNHNCHFCIERSYRKDPENDEKFFINLEECLKQLKAQTTLKSCSITGGEPLLFVDKFNKIVRMIRKYNPNCFITVNTSFRKIPEGVELPSYFNISDHILTEDLGTNVSDEDLANIKTNVRVQTVLYKEEQLGMIFDYIDSRINLKNIEIRGLMNNDIDNSYYSELFLKLINLIDSKAQFTDKFSCFYETNLNFKYNGRKITLASSDMNYLENLEKKEDDNILRELVLTPDGMISGSWFKNGKKIVTK